MPENPQGDVFSAYDNKWFSAPAELRQKARRRLELAAKWVITVSILLLTMYVLIYYISGPSLAFIHSDCTDSLLWSQAMVESGEILTEDFTYAALLPFGSPLWTVPILSVCGYSVNAYVLSMSVFAVLFVLAVFSLFCAMRCSRPVSAAAAFCVSLLLSGSAKLREIMWEHTIYYSLGILLILVLLNLCVRFLSHMDKLKKDTWRSAHSVLVGVFGVLLLLMCAGSATDGSQVLAISVLPVLGAVVATLFFDSDIKLLSRAAANRYILCAVMGVGVGVGMVLLRVFTKDGAITAGYATAYSNWAPMSEWGDNARKFLEHYLTLCGIEIAHNQPLFSLDSVWVMLRLFGALAVLLCPIVLLCRYGKIRHASSKLVLWAHVCVTAVILLGYICGALSAQNWRLTPLLGSSILATLVCLRELYGASDVGKRVSAILAALLLAVSVLNAHAMLNMPHDLGKNRDHAVIAQTLEEKGYTYGYATFWNAQITTLFADDQVKVLTIHVGEYGARKNPYQTLGSRYDTNEGRPSFLLLTAGEYDTITQSDYWTDLKARHACIDEFECCGYRVVVFDGNVVLY